MIIGEKEFKILKMLEENNYKLPRKELQAEFKKDIKNSLSKLTTSGCITYRRNILNERGRENIYILLYKGVTVFNDMNDSEVKKYEIPRR